MHLLFKNNGLKREKEPSRFLFLERVEGLERVWRPGGGGGFIEHFRLQVSFNLP